MKENIDFPPQAQNKPIVFWMGNDSVDQEKEKKNTKQSPQDKTAVCISHPPAPQQYHY